MLKKVFKLTTILVLLYAMGVGAQAAGTSKTASWTPPTHTVSLTDCNTNMIALTPADLLRIVYVVSYRPKGTINWLTVQATTNSTTLSNLKYETTYEAMVGAKWENGVIQCVSEMLEFTTEKEPNPGRCGTFQVK